MGSKKPAAEIQAWIFNQIEGNASGKRAGGAA